MFELVPSQFMRDYFKEINFEFTDFQKATLKENMLHIVKGRVFGKEFLKKQKDQKMLWVYFDRGCIRRKGDTSKKEGIQIDLLYW